LESIPTIYTKENCSRCEALKAFLQKQNIQFKEKDVGNQDVARELLASEYIVKHSCDEKGFIVITPIVKLDGTWMYKEFFDVNGFSERRAMKIFNLV
jgi:glutaredoxin